MRPRPLRTSSPAPHPDDTAFHGRPLFGCFSYAVREGGVVRPHFVANDLPGLSPLGRERVAARQAELRRLFAHVQANVPEATTVLGNSWMYNLAAYRRLFPDAYTAHLPASDEDEFQYLAWWGQCYDRSWHPRPAAVAMLFQRAERLDDLAALRHCFPYQILQPSCPIEIFYQAFSLADSATPSPPSVSARARFHAGSPVPIRPVWLVVGPQGACRARSGGRGRDR